MKNATSRLMTTADLQDLNRPTPYKKATHSFGPLASVGKLYCYKCGLVSLNNKISRWAVKYGCNYKDHPQYKKTLYKFTKR